jgi:hypothetical protein
MSTNDKSDKYVALGARLKFLREQWQQTLNDVSNTLEIDEKMLRAYEAGKIVPPTDILDMLINHFLLTEDQAQDLRELAEDQRDDPDSAVLSGNIEDILSKQLVMFMPVDTRVVYTDSMQATVNDSGVILQFMQQTGNGQSVPISRVGMSRQHAERVIEVLQNTLKHHNQGQDKDKKTNQQQQ